MFLSINPWCIMLSHSYVPKRSVYLVSVCFVKKKIRRKRQREVSDQK